MKFIPYIFAFLYGACFWEFARDAVLALRAKMEYRKTCKRLGTEYVIGPAKAKSKVPFRVPDKGSINNPIEQPQRQRSE